MKLAVEEEGEGYAFATSVEDYPDPKTLASLFIYSHI